MALRPLGQRVRTPLFGGACVRCASQGRIWDIHPYSTENVPCKTQVRKAFETCTGSRSFPCNLNGEGNSRIVSGYGRRSRIESSAKLQSPGRSRQVKTVRGRMSPIPDDGATALRDMGCPSEPEGFAENHGLIAGVCWRPGATSVLRVDFGDAEVLSLLGHGFWTCSAKYPGRLIADCEDGRQIPPAMKRRVCVIYSFGSFKEKRVVILLQLSVIE